MKSFTPFFVLGLFLIFNSKYAFAATQKKSSEIKDYNYVCMHASKPDALIFKTTTPQKIWRTTIDRNGQITKGKAFELSKIDINAESINRAGELASFKGQLTKNYEIRGFFAKDSDGELPLTVISTYLPDGKSSQIKDNYNCELETTNKQIQLGSITKE